MEIVNETTIKYGGLDIMVREYDGGLCVLKHDNTTMYCDDITDRQLKKFLRAVKGEQKV